MTENSNSAKQSALWAPWRMEYIRRDKTDEDGCMFCRKAESSADRANYVIFRGEMGFALLNIYPYNNGHIMVAPYRHVGDLLDLNPEETTEMMNIVRLCLRALRETMAPQGFNVGFNLGQSAGAGIVDHIHLHIVPRWNGDTNFMPVLAGTDVIPQSLGEVYKLLRRSCARADTGAGSVPPTPEGQ